MTARRAMIHAPDKQELKVAFRALVRGAGGVEAAATYCRIGKSQLSDCSIANAETFAPIDVVADLEDVTVGAPGAPHVTRALATRAGFVLVKRPDVNVTSSGWLKRLSVMMKEGGDVAGAIILALADDDAVSPGEASRIIPELDELIEAAIGLRTQLEAVTE